MAYIYKITNIINNKGYVGKTIKSPEKRWKNHLYCAKTDGPMVISRAIRKHGEKNFKFEVIEECLVEEMNPREAHWIEYHDTFHNGYNSSMGGEGAGPGVIRKRGAVHPHAKAVDCYDLNGNYLCTYSSVGEAAHASGIRKRRGVGMITACIKGKTFQAIGHRWSWKGKSLKEVDNRINRRGKVYGVHLESGRKKMWNSQADCAEEINNNRKGNSSIGLALERNDKEDTTKTKVNGWYLFRDRKIALTDWKPAERYIPTFEQSSRAGKMRKGKPSLTLRKPIKGVHIETGEVVKFSHCGEAVEKLRNDNCKINQSGIVRMIKILESGKTHYTCPNWKGLYKPYHHAGYRWYYDVSK
jgi:hypothetical protein|tara:strand:- start:35 stop:1102 length:1068 start_codon:yes stop_codon:yes gene_type:complete